MRAIAGGGRYDNLIGQLSEGATSLPALGFAMGDVVLGELIRMVPAAAEQMATATRTEQTLDAYIVIAKEERRVDALATVQQLRDANLRVDYSLVATASTESNSRPRSNWVHDTPFSLVTNGHRWR